MPPAVAVAGITAAGSLGGAALQSRAAGRAARGQQKAASGAIRREREVEGEQTRRYNQEWQVYNQAFRQREAMKRQLLRDRFGMNLPEPAAPAPMGTQTRMDGSGALAPAPPPSGGTLGALAGFEPFDSQAGPAATPGPPASPLGGAPIPQDGTLGSLAGWSQWSRR